MLALFFAPIFLGIPSAATAPALILVGVMMMASTCFAGEGHFQKIYEETLGMHDLAQDEAVSKDFTINEGKLVIQIRKLRNESLVPFQQFVVHRITVQNQRAALLRGKPLPRGPAFRRRKGSRL